MKAVKYVGMVGLLAALLAAGFFLRSWWSSPAEAACFDFADGSLQILSFPAPGAPSVMPIA